MLLKMATTANVGGDHFGDFMTDLHSRFMPKKRVILWAVLKRIPTSGVRGINERQE